MRIWNGGHFENYRKLLSFKMSQNYLYGVPLNSKTILKFWFTYKFHLQVEISRKMWNRNFYGGHLVLCKLGVFSPIILMGTSRFWKRRFIRSVLYHFGSALGVCKKRICLPPPPPPPLPPVAHRLMAMAESQCRNTQNHISLIGVHETCFSVSSSRNQLDIT